MNQKKITGFISKYGFLIVLLVAVLPRIYLLILNDYVIADDGILYIWQAETIANNGLSSLAPEIFNPYPIAIAVCHWLLNPVFTVSFESTALLITALCGLGLLYPLYKLVNRYFGPLPAFISGIYIGLLPELTEVSCSVLRGAPALCAIMWAFYLFITAVRPDDPSNWRPGKLVAAGVLVILAGLIRLEMFIFFGAFGLTLLLAHTWPGNPYRSRKRFISIVLGGLVLTCLVGIVTGIIYFLALSGIITSDSLTYFLDVLSLLGARLKCNGFLVIELCIFAIGIGLTTLLAHCYPIKPYRLKNRIAAGVALIGVFALCSIAGFTCLRVKTGSWQLGPFRRIFQQHGLSEIKVKEDPFAVNKDLLYGPDGKMKPHVLVQFKFTDLARDHRRFLYIFEVGYKFWKAFLPLGLVMFFAGVWFVFQRKMLPLTDPLIICSILLCAIILSVYYLYASTHFYVATRHVLALVIPLSVFIGIPVLYLPGSPKLVKLAAMAFAVAALSMLCYKTLQPIRLKKLPMKRSGLILKEYLPEDAILFTASSQKQVPYYAHAEYRMFTPQGIAELHTRLVKTPNRYLVLNTHDPWQAEYAQMTSVLTRVDIELAKGGKYDFSLYRARGSEQE